MKTVAGYETFCDWIINADNDNDDVMGHLFIHPQSLFCTFFSPH